MSEYDDNAQDLALHGSFLREPGQQLFTTGQGQAGQVRQVGEKGSFDYFQQGMRPSQLPDLGVKRVTLYRYYEW